MSVIHRHGPPPINSEMAIASASPPLLLSRLPILDESGTVFGYELRYAAVATLDVECGEPDGARVLTTAVTACGLDAITGGRPAFVRFSPEMLLSGCAGVLPPTALVVELPGRLDITPQLLQACQTLAERGYALGLERFDADCDVDLLLPYLRFVRIDMRSASAVAEATFRSVRRRGVRLLAHRVDTAGQRAEAYGIGCRLFQGRYLLSSTTVSTASPSTAPVAYMRLLSALNQPNLSNAALEDIVKAEPMLVYQLLRAVNSAAFPLCRQISSIREALVLLGQDQIRRWTMVWALASLTPNRHNELIATGLMRARACEWLGSHHAPDHSSELFLAGLCSILAAVVGWSTEQLACQLPLTEPIRTALVGGESLLSDILKAVIAHEQGEWDVARSAAARAGVAPERLTDAHLEAVRWTHTIKDLL